MSHMPELAAFTAFLAGLLGSTHCLGMCGGIATALGASGQRSLWQPLLYQLGRLSSYAAAGAVAGGVGAAAGFAFAVSRWSEWLRLATAVVVIVIGLDISFGATARTAWLRAPERWGARLWRRIAPTASRWLPTAPAARALALGLLWGWLPCGLVYSVLLAAAVAGSAARGGATMLAFGIGTLPAMGGLSYLGGRLPRRDSAWARLLGSCLVACGLLTATVPLAVLGGSTAHAHHHVTGAMR
jgi:sulfite exporter TauE/SafE